MEMLNYVKAEQWLHRLFVTPFFLLNHTFEVFYNTL